MAGVGSSRPYGLVWRRVNLSNDDLHSSIDAELDAAGNRVGVTDKDSKYTSWMLDPEYQLKSETKWSAKSATASREFQYAYGYDPNGNRIKLWDDGTLTASTFGDNNEQLTSGSTSFTYDHFGNTTAIGSDTFTWNSEGHLLTGTHSSSVDTHEYNGDGVRMRSKLNNAADWTNFIYDPLESAYPAILAEYTLISSTFTIKSLNTHGIGLINTNREGTKRYFHFDGLGSTWALTDSSEVVQDTYTWSAFGIQEASTGSSVNPFRYVGQWGYYDDSARGSNFGIVLLGRRYYSPSLGRFLSWDPVTASNAFLYAHNAPHIDVDPSGLYATIDLPTYENYCGLQFGGYGQPVDPLDRCCYKHDKCYAEMGCDFRNRKRKLECKVCDLWLCLCAGSVKCDNLSCEAVRGIIFLFICRNIPGDLPYIEPAPWTPDPYRESAGDVVGPPGRERIR